MVSSLVKKARATACVHQSAHLAQGECDSRLLVERRVATGEDEPQAIVAEYFRVILVNRLLQRRLRRRQVSIDNFCPEQLIAADSVDRLVAACADQPGARIVRRALGRPLFDGRREGVLLRLLGQIEIAEQADQGCENPTRLSAKYFFNHLADRISAHRIGGLVRLSGQMGRTSMLPYLAPGNARRDGGGFIEILCLDK